MKITSCFLFLVKSGDLNSATALFNSIKVKTSPLYITLFKGRLVCYLIHQEMNVF